jgi:hypothetical protein
MHDVFPGTIQVTEIRYAMLAHVHIGNGMLLLRPACQNENNNETLRSNYNHKMASFFLRLLRLMFTFHKSQHMCGAGELV